MADTKDTKATFSPSEEAAIKAGIKTTRSLSSSPNSGDLEQYTGVSVLTMHGKDGLIRVYLSFGVYYTELTPLTDAESKQLAVYHQVHKDFAFCIYSLDEFIEDVGKKGGYHLFWPRTKQYFSIPLWYRAKLDEALSAFRRCTTLSPTLLSVTKSESTASATTTTATPN